MEGLLAGFSMSPQEERQERQKGQEGQKREKEGSCFPAVSA